MANKIFDRETLLDLTVNVIPLFIIAFFVIGFALFPTFGTELLPTALQFGLLVVPFILLAILTYLSGKAIAGDEKRSTVYIPGQATVPGATPLHEEEAETEPSGELTDESESDADGESTESAAKAVDSDE
jgi:hypothetical protein